MSSQGDEKEESEEEERKTIYPPTGSKNKISRTMDIFNFPLSRPTENGISIETKHTKDFDPFPSMLLNTTSTVLGTTPFSSLLTPSPPWIVYDLPEFVTP